MRTHSVVGAAAALLIVCAAAPADAQTTPPKNPSEISFSCADHAIDTDHEVGFFLAGATAPVQSQRVGDPAPALDGSIRASINSRPVGLALGVYEMKVRVYAGTQVSAWGAGGADGQTPVPFEAALRPPTNLTVAR